jgi:hypothetical protein
VWSCSACLGGEIERRGCEPWWGCLSCPRRRSVSVTAALGFDPGAEARNVAKTHERSREEFLKPDFQALLAQRFVDNVNEENEIKLTDPSETTSGTSAVIDRRSAPGTCASTTGSRRDTG